MGVKFVNQHYRKILTRTMKLHSWKRYQAETDEIQKNNDPDPAKITIECDACVESITQGVHARIADVIKPIFTQVTATRETPIHRPCERNGHRHRLIVLEPLDFKRQRETSFN